MHGNDIQTGLLMVFCGACIALVTGTAVQAAEGGTGLYAPGYIAPQAGLMPDPGTYFGYNFYSYKGSSTTEVSAAGQVPLGGTGLKLPIQLNGSVKAEVDSYAHLLSVTHVFSEKVLGGQVGISLLLPYINADLDLNGTGVLSVIGPLGNTHSIPVGGQASFSDSGVGDISLSGLLGWHQERMHYMAMLNVYAPTGDYDKTHVLNIGKNHWALEPMGAVTYLNEKTGLELSGAVGITFNQKNSDTDYKSGNELHIDLAAIQHFSDRLYAGLVSYRYQQLTGDSGSGAPSGGYEGRVYGYGPMIGGVIPLGQKQKLFVNARYYFESGAQNRTQGDAFFITGVVKF